MGSLFSPSEQKTTSTSTPWGPQGDALRSAFGDAANIYASQQGTPFYGGDLYANMNPLTDQGIQASQNFSTGAGADAANSAMGAGSDMLGLGGRAYDALFSAAGQDPTKANIAAAGQYADNPYMSGMIDAASRDVTRNLYENQIPGLNQAATGSGNMDSSRAGVAQGIMSRGAADQIGDIASSMRGQAYSQGLGLAENARSTNMNALNAATGAFGQGMGAMGQGYGMANQNNQNLIQGGQLYQQDAQGQDNADFAQWQGQDQRPNDLLQRYYGIIGANNWGGTSTGTTPGPSMFQNLLGAASTAAGAAMAFSDPRLKANVQPTGELTKDGIPLVAFDYIATPGLDLPRGRQVGVMATDVAKVRRDAIGVKDGYLQVDYGKLN
jgi:hypothetical protein